MNVKFALADVTSTSSRIRSVFLLFVLAYLELVGATTTSSSKAQTKAQNDDNSGMIKGMAAGFAGFFALIVLICALWCCCCGSDESSSRCCCKKKPKQDNTCATGRKPAPADRCKVAPSPPQSATSWSRSH